MYHRIEETLIKSEYVLCCAKEESLQTHFYHKNNYKKLIPRHVYVVSSSVAIKF